MGNAVEVLRACETVLVIDWPRREVPESLVRAGLRVIVRGGPGPEDFSAYEVQGEEVVSRRIGRAPERVDLVYAYRPLNELPQIIDTAKSFGAKAIWMQAGLTGARSLVEAAGLSYFDEPYIGDAARLIQGSK